ncbi:hypothetical protein Vadar_026819 [Vaccinium darrowii]|uniref:Uncharacterized protein n=1 Tax=Vaccinium darrowii TaxID=229202 RepID=A0ACB7YYH7_9ERIC|nr:hypothetical protein Vadar_026819 [Vaccinium darrowii]
MTTSPPRFVYITSDITDNVDEFDQALSSLVDSLVTRVTNGSSVGKFATGEISYMASKYIYGLVQCVPGLSSADCSTCIRRAIDYYRDCCFRKSGVNIITPSCIFQYDSTYFFESSAGAAPPPPPPSPPPPPVSLSPPPLSTDVGTNGGDKGRTIQTTLLIVVPVCDCTESLASIRAAGRLFKVSRQHGVHSADGQMNPKIADFGTARLFVVDQSKGITKKIAGTRGYMPPEYAQCGVFSVKTDVFSFGVLILEIVSGKKYSGYFGPEDGEHLISYAWKKWRQGKASSLFDETIDGGSNSDKMRCIHIGLLCVQENVAKRPTMGEVVLMFNSFSMSLPSSSKPAFLVESSMEQNTAIGNRFCSVTRAKLYNNIVDKALYHATAVPWYKVPVVHCVTGKGTTATAPDQPLLELYGAAIAFSSSFAFSSSSSSIGEHVQRRHGRNITLSPAAAPYPKNPFISTQPGSNGG